MPLETSWLLEKRIAYLRSYGLVTPEDLQATADAVLACISEGDAPVHILLDHTQVEKFPTQISAFKQFVFPNPHPKTGMVVLVSPNKLALFFISVIVQLSKTKMHTFSTLGEGIAFLGRVDRTLPALNADLIR